MSTPVEQLSKEALAAMETPILTPVKKEAKTMKEDKKKLKKEIVQLHKEVKIERMSVSDAIKDLMKYCNENSEPMSRAGPSKESSHKKKKCSLL